EPRRAFTRESRAEKRCAALELARRVRARPPIRRFRGLAERFDQARDLRGVRGSLRRAPKPQRRSLVARDPATQDLSRALAQEFRQPWRVAHSRSLASEEHRCHVTIAKGGTLKLQSVARSDVGRRRPINEDAFFRDDQRGFYVVADGVGGHNKGEIAS